MILKNISSRISIGLFSIVLLSASYNIYAKTTENIPIIKDYIAPNALNKKIEVGYDFQKMDFTILPTNLFKFLKGLYKGEGESINLLGVVFEDANKASGEILTTHRLYASKYATSNIKFDLGYSLNLETSFLDIQRITRVKKSSHFEFANEFPLYQNRCLPIGINTVALALGASLPIPLFDSFGIMVDIPIYVSFTSRAPLEDSISLSALNTSGQLTKNINTGLNKFRYTLKLSSATYRFSFMSFQFSTGIYVLPGLEPSVIYLPTKEYVEGKILANVSRDLILGGFFVLSFSIPTSI